MLCTARRLLLVALAVFGAVGVGARPAAPPQVSAAAGATGASSATHALRATPAEGERAGRADATTTARIAASARVQAGPHRTTDSHAWPEFANTLLLAALRPATTTGLRRAPLTSRALAIPFDATAPPRTL